MRLQSTSCAWLQALPVLAATLLPGGAVAEVEPVDFTIAAGQALFVEFELDDPGAIYPDFHAFEADWKPFQPVPGGTSFTAVVRVFDPITEDALGESLPVFVNVTEFLSAIGPTFCDPMLAPDPTHCASHPEAADLSDYADGPGLVALLNQAGDPFRVGGVELLYGRYAPGGASGEFVKPAFTVTDAYVPEPAPPLLVAVAVLTTAMRFGGRRPGAR